MIIEHTYRDTCVMIWLCGTLWYQWKGRFFFSALSCGTVRCFAAILGDLGGVQKGLASCYRWILSAWQILNPPLMSPVVFVKKKATHYAEWSNVTRNKSMLKPWNFDDVDSLLFWHVTITKGSFTPDESVGLPKITCLEGSDKDQSCLDFLL